MDKKKCIIIDLEGTLSDHSARLHHLEKKDYDAYNHFFKDDPVNELFLKILKGQKALHGEDTRIFLVTAKSIEHKNQVQFWLDKNKLWPLIDGIPQFRELLDSRSSVLVKRDILHALQEEYEVIKAFDDRQDICDMFESEGVTAINVGIQPTHKASDILLNLSQLHREKNEEYGNGYLEFGKIFIGLFPDGVELKKESDFTRFGALNIMVSKLDRYCKNFDKGGHPDSLDDLSVYTAMLREIDDGIE